MAAHDYLVNNTMLFSVSVTSVVKCLKYHLYLIWVIVLLSDIT